MSELTIRPTDNNGFRWQLMTTVSVVALAGFVCVADKADAAEADRPSVWIELGGQLEHYSGSEDPFGPSFLLKHLDASYNFQSPLGIQKPPRYSFGGEGKLSFQPDGSRWTFSAAVRFGRSNGSKSIHQQTEFYIKQYILGPPANPFERSAFRFDQVGVEHRESQAVLDFAAGRDVGVGMFGNGGSSLLAFGVRFAQFTAQSNTTIRSRPDVYYKTNEKYTAQNPANAHVHGYYGKALLGRSFHGIGPSLSWAGRSPFAGSTDGGELTFDWGANAAVLFGRQKVSGTHLTTGRYYQGKAGAVQGLGPPLKSQYARSAPINRSRSVIVPNVGGFAGFSFNFPNAKLSMGYRADFFFGAMDAGVDMRHTKDLGFHGPFATVSIGLGG